MNGCLARSTGPKASYIAYLVSGSFMFKYSCVARDDRQLNSINSKRAINIIYSFNYSKQTEEPKRS